MSSGNYLYTTLSMDALSDQYRLWTFIANDFERLNELFNLQGKVHQPIAHRSWDSYRSQFWNIIVIV